MRNFDTDLADLDQLQISYGDALDRQDMSEWLAQFCDDLAASYICTTTSMRSAACRSR
jgi:3-phenylpropionate/cinnamic acid dioxygenase small subunit